MEKINTAVAQGITVTVIHTNKSAERSTANK
jgi:hypothetical protein